MPFDYEEYDSKCSTLSPEALQKEWENYTRHIAGGATSTAGSVLFAPFTAGASLVGLGLSTPRIHNARKKRAIIEMHLQARGTTHNTRKRDVVAPMAIAGTLGGLTLGLAGPGADLIAGEVVGKGVEYVVSHAALEAAGATLEHKHDDHKKTKDRLELAMKYGHVDGPAIDRRGTHLSSQAGSETSLRKSKSENHLDGLAYGSMPAQKIPKKPQRAYQDVSQQHIMCFPLPPKHEGPSTMNSLPPSKSGPATQTVQATGENLEIRSESGMKLPYFNLPDHDEAENHGLRWDPLRGTYVQPQTVNFEGIENPSTLPRHAHLDLQPSQSQSDELEDLISQLFVENSIEPKETATVDVSGISSENVGKENMQFQGASLVQTEPVHPLQQYYSAPPLQNEGERTSHPFCLRNTQGQDHASGSLSLLNPEGKSPALLSLPQCPALPPRPKSSIGSYATPPSRPIRLEQHSHLPSPSPSQQRSQQHAAKVLTLQQHYNPQHYSSLPSAAQAVYQPSRVQFPQYQHYTAPPFLSNQSTPSPARRPSPQPLQHQYPQAHIQQRQEYTSSISTASSASTSTSISLTSSSTVSAASTPLTSYSTSTGTPTLMSSCSHETASYDLPPRLDGANPSPKPEAPGIYFPPPPMVATVGKGEKGRGRDYFG